MFDQAETPPTQAPTSPTGRSSALGRLSRLVSWAAFGSLLAWNGWALWLDWTPKDPAVVDAMIARGQNEEARLELVRILRSSPDDDQSRMKLARVLAILGDRAGCADALHQVPAWSPSKSEALFMEGQVDKLLERARGAEAAWKALVADDPLHPVSRRYYHGAARDLVGVYILERRLVEAREVLWKIHEVGDPAEKPGILLQRIRAELELIAHPEAAAQLRLHVAADPEDWEARRALAFEEHALGDESAADRDIRACLDARPDDVPTWRDWFRILAERGDTATIRANLARLPAGADGDAALWVARGNIHQIDGDAKAAASAFGNALRIDPYLPEAAYKLGQAEQILGNQEQATIHRERSRQLYKSQGELRGAYEAVLEASQKSIPDREAYKAAVRKLSAICRDLGWARESEAWLRVIAGG